MSHSSLRGEFPARSRGSIVLVEQNCTSCMLCARECPVWCIHIDSHQETTPLDGSAGTGTATADAASTAQGVGRRSARDRTRNVLDRFAIDWGVCMYCSICIEVCPFDALHWSPDLIAPEGDLRDLVHEKTRLGPQAS